MHILIDISNNLGGGGLQVALSFLQECKKIEEHTYTVVVKEKNASLIDINLFSDNFSFYIVDYNHLLEIHPKLKKIEIKVKPDIVFSVFGPSYWKPNVPHCVGYAIPHYIYPESPFFRQCTLRERIKFFIKKMIHLTLLKYEADCIITETEDATNRIKKLLKANKIRYETVSNTCSSYFTNYDGSINLAYNLLQKRKNDFYFLYLCKYYSHKNIELLPKLVDKLLKKGIDNIKFVLSIDTETYQKIIPPEFSHMIVTVGSVLPEDAPSLYDKVDAIIQPSLLEVFSANYAEAMVMNKPVFASDYGFARTVCGDAAYYFDPLNVDETVDKLLTFVEDNELRNTLILKGQTQLKTFNTAEQRAQKYIEICEKMIKKHQFSLINTPWGGVNVDFEVALCKKFA